MDEDELRNKLIDAINMLHLFGDRFINVDNLQAMVDIDNRNYMVSCFNCIMNLFNEVVEKKGD